MKTIVLIGAGNVATHIATKLALTGHTILQVYSRTEVSAKALAEQINAAYTNDVQSILTNADFYIFSVKDSALVSLIENMPQTNGTWIHTAGSMPLDIFKSKRNDYGVLYPLQTFSKGKYLDWSKIPLFIEASNKNSLTQIEGISQSLSNKIYNLPSEKRKYIHASGVFACNFVNHMYELANTMIDKTDLPFEVLLPLIEETCEKVHVLTPHDAQTGPAIRWDENVMNKHPELLDNDTQHIYKVISESIHKKHKK